MYFANRKRDGKRGKKRKGHGFVDGSVCVLRTQYSIRERQYSVRVDSTRSASNILYRYTPYSAHHMYLQDKNERTKPVANAWDICMGYAWDNIRFAY